MNVFIHVDITNILTCQSKAVGIKTRMFTMFDDLLGARSTFAAKILSSIFLFFTVLELNFTCQKPMEHFIHVRIIIIMCQSNFTLSKNRRF